MLSSNHSLFDDRIYWKEASALKEAGYEVCHISVGEEEKSFVSDVGIRLVQLKRGAKEKLHIITSNSKSIYQRLFAAARQEKADVYTFHDWQINVIGKKLKQLSHSPVVIYDVLEATADMLRSDLEEKSWFRRMIAEPYIRMISRWELKCAKSYDWIITCEEKVADNFAKAISPEKITCVHNYSFFDPDQFASINRTFLYDVVYAGGIMPQRGIRELIDSIAIVKKTIPEIRALIIGTIINEEFGDLIREKIKANKLEQNVIVHAAVPFSEIDSYYLRSRIGICGWYPNSKNLFSIPIKIFEYMALGLPVIMTNKGVAADYITKSDSGVLVNPYSPEEIANAIVLLLKDHEMYKKYSENGRQAVRERYTWQKEKSIFLKVFETLLASKS